MLEKLISPPLCFPEILMDSKRIKSGEKGRVGVVAHLKQRDGKSISGSKVSVLLQSVSVPVVGVLIYYK